jgi:hypothetical protein
MKKSPKYQRHQYKKAWISAAEQLDKHVRKLDSAW